VPKDVHEGKVDVIQSEHVQLLNTAVVEGRKLTGAESDISDDWKSFPNMRMRLPK